MFKIITHTISSDNKETLDSIALQYNTTASDIKKLNRLQFDVLFPGQKLSIRVKEEKKEEEETKKEEEEENREEEIENLIHFDEHVVSWNDTLSTIALVYGMKVVDLKLINNLKGNQIYNGQVLKVVKNKSDLDSLLKRKRSMSYSSQPVISRNKTATRTTAELKSVPSLFSSTPASKFPSVQSISPTDSKKAVENNVEKRSPPKLAANQPRKETPQKITPPQQHPQPSQPKKQISQVEEFYNSLQQFGFEKAVQSLNKDRISKKEPCRFLDCKAKTSVLGLISLNESLLIFEPHPKDTTVLSRGAVACQLILELADINAPMILDEAEVNHPKKGLGLFFNIPAGKLRYLHISKLVDPDDYLSAIEKEYYLAIHTNTIHNFYNSLLEYACVAKENREARNATKPIQLQPNKTSISPKGNSPSSPSSPMPNSPPTKLPQLPSTANDNTAIVDVGKVTPRGGSDSVPQSPRSETSEFVVPEILFTKPAPLLHPSVILNLEKDKDALTAIRNSLPVALRFKPWSLVFSTDKHGVSFRTFYSKLAEWESSIILIEDTQGHVFGGFASCTWEMQESYFGTGESFLFRLHPNFQIYTTENELNNYYMLAKKSHFEMGAGGKPGLWVGEDFVNGLSGKSDTYQNDCLASSEDFKIYLVEVWGFAFGYHPE